MASVVADLNTPPISLLEFAEVTKTVQIAIAKGNGTCGSFSAFVCTLDYFCLLKKLESVPTNTMGLF